MGRFKCDHIKWLMSVIVINDWIKWPFFEMWKILLLKTQNSFFETGNSIIYSLKWRMRVEYLHNGIIKSQHNNKNEHKI